MKKESIDFKKKILTIKPFKTKSYENFDLDRLAIYAMHFLEEKKIPLYFDYIASTLFKLFPEKFSMANFKQYPDTNRISKALRRLVDEKRRNWATGSIENGFYMTETGKEIAIQVGNLLLGPYTKSKRPLPVFRKSRGRSPKDDMEEIKGSEVFQRWQQNNYKITDYDILSFLKAVPYTPKILLLQYLNNLKQSAAMIKDKKTVKFLQWVEEKFYNLFH